MVLSLLYCKLSVVIHALALHLEEHGVTDQAAVGFSLLDSCLELNDSVLSFLAIPAPQHLLSKGAVASSRCAMCSLGVIDMLVLPTA